MGHNRVHVDKTDHTRLHTFRVVFEYAEPITADATPTHVYRPSHTFAQVDVLAPNMAEAIDIAESTLAQEVQLKGVQAEYILHHCERH